MARTCDVGSMPQKEGSSLASDMSDADLALALFAIERPDLLRSLINTSRQVFGHFHHYPHVPWIGYPWIARRLEGLPPGARILDIGAGMGPLPLWLAERGYVVDTIDGHRTIRTLPAADDWNGWGYFDYHQVHDNITSYHCAAEDFSGWDSRFDSIYSACVLPQLLTHQAAHAVLQNCREHLKPGGLLLLMVDLIPSTDFLWNRAEGREVEPLLIHGTSHDLIQQLNGFDLKVDDFQVIRAIRDSRTDLSFISAAAV